MTDAQAEGPGARRPSWLLAVGLAGLTIVLILQKTKQAMLPRTQTPVLWAAEVVSAAAALLLWSGWLRDNRWREEQRRLGTVANDFYEPRRAWLINAFAVGAGVFGGLWWGIATWAVVLGGMRRNVAGRGLADFEVATFCGVVSGAILGAAIGLIVGHLWEHRHRRARRDRAAAHA